VRELKTGAERKQNLVDPRIVHRLKARRIKVEKPLLHHFVILRPEMTDRSLLPGFEPPIAVPHEHNGVAEVLLKCDFV
jgi:hypothetical protein